MAEATTSNVEMNRSRQNSDTVKVSEPVTFPTSSSLPASPKCDDTREVCKFFCFKEN